MATRPNKTNGNQTYTAEVASGATTIKASEVDGDLNEIFANITDVNVSIGANIATAKLANDLGITSGKLAPNSVTTTKLVDLAVTTAKLATGAAVNALQSTFVLTGVTAGVSDTLIATLPNLTTRGGRVAVLGAVTGLYTLPTAGGNELRFSLKRDTSPPTGLVTVAVWQVIGAQNNNASAVIQAIFAPVIAVDSGLAANTYVYTLTAAKSIGSGVFFTNGTAGSPIFAIEFA